MLQLKMKQRNKRGFLPMLLDTLATILLLTLLWSIPSDKGVIRRGYGVI